MCSCTTPRSWPRASSRSAKATAFSSTSSRARRACRRRTWSRFPDRQVALADRGQVMQLVPGDVPGQAAHRCGVAGDGAAPQPRLVRERAEEREGRAPRERVVVDEIAQRQLLEARGGDAGVLVEAGQRARVAARDAQRAVGEDPLVVDEMAEDLLERPLARRVAEAGDGALVEAAEQLLDLPLLRAS